MKEKKGFRVLYNSLFLLLVGTGIGFSPGVNAEQINDIPQFNSIEELIKFLNQWNLNNSQNPEIEPTPEQTKPAESILKPITEPTTPTLKINPTPEQSKPSEPILPQLKPQDSKTNSSKLIQIKATNYPILSEAYYVSNQERVNSSCNFSDPCSVEKAIKIAPSGATIVFRSGTYRNVNKIKILKKLTLQPYPNEQVWIKGSQIVDGWMKEGKLWRKDNWEIFFPPLSSMKSNFINSKYPIAGHRDMIFVNGSALKQVGSKNQVNEGTFFADAAGKRLYIGSNPTGKRVEVTGIEEAFEIWQGNKSNPRGTTIRGLGFAQFADQPIDIIAPQITLENNTLVWNGLSGIKFGGNGDAVDAIIRDNTISYNGLRGLGGEGAHRMLLENNTISFNNFERFNTYWAAAAAKVVKTQGVVWRNNVVENNWSHGLWIDESSTNAVMANNSARYNDGFGLFFEISNRAIIAGNVAYDNGGGILVSNSSDVKVYNNTLVNNALNFHVKDTPRTTYNGFLRSRGITWITQNNVVKNNIFSGGTGDVLVEASSCETRQRSAKMAYFDHNVYYRQNDNQALLRWSFGGRKCYEPQRSLTSFQTATGQEWGGVETDSPLFLNTDSGNFQLKPGSLAVGRGEALPQSVAEAVGLPVGRKIDLGALQLSN